MKEIKIRRLIWISCLFLNSLYECSFFVDCVLLWVVEKKFNPQYYVTYLHFYLLCKKHFIHAYIGMKIKRRQKRDLYIRVRAKFELSGQTFKLKYNFGHWSELDLSFSYTKLFINRNGSSLDQYTWSKLYVRDHPYITSAKELGGWGQKIGNFCWFSVSFMLTRSGWGG